MAHASSQAVEEAVYTVFAYIAYYKEAIATGETSNDSQQRKQF
jgi:hypothetical protein